MAHHVLVVDDDPDIRGLIATALDWEGVAVSTATNGRDALADITTDHPCVVLLDLNMPVMNGWELLAHLRTLPTGVPVVIMTAGDQARAEAQRQHVAGYLSKPFDIDDLLRVVEPFTHPSAGSVGR